MHRHGLLFDICDVVFGAPARLVVTQETEMRLGSVGPLPGTRAFGLCILFQIDIGPSGTHHTFVPQAKYH